MNVTVRNIITSMRQISAIDWSEVFERVSLVDDALRKGSRFAESDFQTRDSYRREIENIARHSNATELEVTRQALDLAQVADDPAAREGDPGYYLLGEGAPVLRQRTGYAAGPVERIRAGPRVEYAVLAPDVKLSQQAMEPQANYQHLLASADGVTFEGRPTIA